jgi:hypothetical protein
LFTRQIDETRRQLRKQLLEFDIPAGSLPKGSGFRFVHGANRNDYLRACQAIAYLAVRFFRTLCPWSIGAMITIPPWATFA